MKETGMVRRIDDLGRIVIPKEMRKKMQLKVQDPVEFFFSEEGIILKKYYETEELVDIMRMAKVKANEICDQLSPENRKLIIKHIEEICNLIKNERQDEA